jgi:hypothetical protein
MGLLERLRVFVRPSVTQITRKLQSDKTLLADPLFGGFRMIDLQRLSFQHIKMKFDNP